MSPAPEKYWRRAYGDVIPAWNYERSDFGHRARIRTGRTTDRVLWMGPWRYSEREAASDLMEYPRVLSREVKVSPETRERAS